MLQFKWLMCGSVTLGTVALSLLLADEPKETPESVARAFHAAKEIKALMPLVTQKSQAALAGLICFSVKLEAEPPFSFLGKRAPTVQEQKRIDAINEVLKRHGINPGEVMATIVEADKEPKSKDSPLRGLIVLGDRIKDKPAFVAEINAVSESAMKVAPEKSVVSDDLDVDMRLDESRATVSDSRGMNKLELQLENGVWKVDLIETARHAPNPTPQGLFNGFSTGS